MMQEQPEAFEEATSVFEGRVASVSRAPDPTAEVVVALDIVRRWKGVDAEQVQIVTAGNSAACGFEFEQGRSYLVYTHAPTDEQGNRLEGPERVSLCSRTKRIEEAGDDLAAMGTGITPVSPHSPEDEIPAATPEQGASHQAGCASCAVGARSRSGVAPPGLMPAGLVLALAFLRRRLRKTTS